MRIAMIIARYPPESAGAEIQCQRLSTALAALGHNITVLTENRRPDLPYEEFHNGVRIIRMPTRGKPPWSSFVFALKLLKFFLKNPHYDVLHAHLIALPAIFALIWGRLSRTPVLVKTAGAGPTGDVYTSKVLRRGRLKLFLFKRWVTSVVTPSGRSRLELLEIGVDESRIRVIPNGVDFNRFRPATLAERAQSRARLSLQEDEPVAIFTGRWVHGKNVELLLDTWEKGRTQVHFKWKLLLIIGGHGIPLAAKTRLEALRTHVIVRENPGPVLPFYHAADLAVLLSIGEGLSNFLLEGMACGLPTLTSESAAITSSTDRDQWGWTLPDPALSVDSITRFLSDHSQQRSVLTAKGFEARRHVEAHFSLTATAQAYETFYRLCRDHVTV